MGDIAIHVEHLGKEYRIGQKAPYMTFRDAITNATIAPFKRIASGEHANDIQEKFWALKDISFDLEKGEAVGIIGRNGAGKSTLLKILSKITEPTEGSATIYGRIGSLLEVGTGFHPELTGRENVYLSGAILGMTRAEIEKRFDDIVKFSEVEKFLDTPLKHYSSGMQVRLGFAVAAHLEPEILVVDEVLAVGDARFQNKCLGKMKEVTTEGRTVLFVSHNMNAVERLCNRAILLNNGHIEHDSTNVSETIHDYLYGDSNSNFVEWTNLNNLYNNAWFSPLKLYLSDGKIKQDMYSNDSDIWINIIVEIKKIDERLQLGYAIFNEDGVFLYWSFQTDSEESKWPRLETGIHTLKSKIPRHLLNEGTYKIVLLAAIYCQEWIINIENAPSIFLTINGGLSYSPYWIVKRSGTLAPIIEWYIE